MKREIGVVMDPIGSIKIAKDSSFAMMLAAQRRGWDVQYMTLADLFLRGTRTWGRMRKVELTDDPAGWHHTLEEATRPLDTLDLVLMRKDPPFDMEYVYATYLLGHAQGAGTLVVNHPQALRAANEKRFALQFPQC